MKQQEHVQKALIIASEWFKDHRATIFPYTCYKQAIPITVIEWRKPETSNYAILYTLINNMVIVVGDIGDAVYGFCCRATMEFLATTDWYYFTSKCCASETGRDYSMKVPGISQKVPHIRAIAHHVGLLMAIKQLKDSQQ